MRNGPRGGARNYVPKNNRERARKKWWAVVGGSTMWAHFGLVNLHKFLLDIEVSWLTNRLYPMN